MASFKSCDCDVVSYRLTVAFFSSGEHIYASKITQVLFICEDYLTDQNVQVS